MFTGIVQGVARVRRAADGAGLRRLTMSFPEGATVGLVPGASVSISGVCLTAVTVGPGAEVDFDVIGETLAVTTLGALQPGDAVDFERAARFGDEIGGHLLSGHVSEAGVVRERIEDQGNLTLWIDASPEALRYILPKGYVAVRGASLTVGEVDGRGFSVHLIPETRRITTLGEVAVGERVNLEVDAATRAVVDTVERVLAGSRRTSG
jgi:riboflavin synthase